MTKEQPIWKSKKFIYSALAAATFVVLGVTGANEFSNGEVLTFILSLLGLNVGSHAATDIASILKGPGGKPDAPAE
jgi:TM2 domain-containing membrane protein YozV